MNALSNLPTLLTESRTRLEGSFQLCRQVQTSTLTMRQMITETRRRIDETWHLLGQIEQCLPNPHLIQEQIE
jgi:hypothetical protein